MENVLEITTSNDNSILSLLINEHHYKYCILCINNKDYTIQQLTDLSDEEFDKIYKSFEPTVDMGSIINSFVIINTMKRMSLERRVARLESALEEIHYRPPGLGGKHYESVNSSTLVGK